jgi:hypothetical protein
VTCHSRDRVVATAVRFVDAMSGTRWWSIRDLESELEIQTRQVYRYLAAMETSAPLEKRFVQGRVQYRRFRREAAAA